MILMVSLGSIVKRPWRGFGLVLKSCYRICFDESVLKISIKETCNTDYPVARSQAKRLYFGFDK